MEAEDFDSGEVLFAPVAAKPRSQARNRTRKLGEAVLTARTEIDETAIEHEFDWQQAAADGKAPLRKRMLCYTLRRLMRLRMEQSFRRIEETRELFLLEWCELRK